MGDTATNGNITVFVVSEYSEVTHGPDLEYEHLLADVWVGIVLTLMVLSCICCMCSCLLYHKFQHWKRNVEAARRAADIENGYHPDFDNLPNYTIVSGLPSYEEALQQLQKVNELRKAEIPLSKDVSSSTTRPTPNLQRLSVTDLFQCYRTNENVTGTKS